MQVEKSYVNIFRGTWRITRICTKLFDKEIMINNLCGPEFLLKFTAGNRWELSSGEIIFEGLLGDPYGKHISYVYVPSCSLLRVGRPIDFSRNTVPSMVFHYRVTRFTETEYWLCDLAGADKSSVGYKLRFKIERLR